MTVGLPPSNRTNEPVSGSKSSTGSNISLMNTSSSIDGSDDMLHAFNDILGVGVTGSLSLLGVAGNALTFIVLQRSYSRSPMFYVLRMLSLSDGIFLLTVFTLQTVVNLYQVTSIPALSLPYYYRGYIQYFVWPWLMTTQMTTVWLTVLVSCERFVAVCYPFREAHICTIAKIRHVVIGIIVMSIIFNLPRFFEFTPVYDSPMLKTGIGLHFLYRYLYTCALYSILLFFLPLLLLLVLNLLLVLALRRGRRKWQHLLVRQRRQQNQTVVPLTIVLIFFICDTPSLIVNIVESVNPRLFVDNAAMVAFMVSANFLVVVNSASNIFVYFLLGRRFRNRLTKLLCCKKLAHNEAPSVRYFSGDRQEIYSAYI